MSLDLVVVDNGMKAMDQMQRRSRRKGKMCMQILVCMQAIYSGECHSRIIYHQARPDNVETSTAYDLVDVLTASAQNAVHMLCESISCRTPGLSERTKKVAAFTDL